MTISRRNYGKGHSYTIDGKKVDGVTTLIKGGLPSPALMYWSARTVAEYVADNCDSVRGYMDTMQRDQLVQHLKGVPWSVRDRAAVNGTAVHDLAEKLVAGEEVDVPEHLSGFVDACVQMLDDWQLKPVLVESVVGSRHWRYAGTLDLVADAPDGKRWLLDWKTGASGVWPETILQLAAYRYADVYLDAEGNEQPMSALNITDVGAVHLREDGYSVIPLPSDEQAFRMFNHCAWIARWSKTAKELIGEPITPTSSEVAA